MDCRAFRARLRGPAADAPDRTGPGAGRLDEAARRHAAACPKCAADLRAFTLLALGSPAGAAPGPGPGFEERLRARLASEAARAGAGAARPEASWLDAIGWLARPALGMAAALVVASAGLYVWVAPGPSPSGSVDLAQMVEGDPVLDRLLAGETVGFLASPSLDEEALSAGAAEEER